MEQRASIAGNDRKPRRPVLFRAHPGSAGTGPAEPAAPAAKPGNAGPYRSCWPAYFTIGLCTLSKTPVWSPIATILLELPIAGCRRLH